MSEDSDRLGLRLEGASMALESPREMISEGVSLGAVQVTPSGQPIILFVEQQTAGRLSEDCQRDRGGSALHRAIASAR